MSTEVEKKNETDNQTTENENKVKVEENENQKSEQNSKEESIPKEQDNLSQESTTPKNTNTEVEKVVEIDEKNIDYAPKKDSNEIKEKVQEIQNEIKGTFEDYSKSVAEFKNASQSLAEQENKIVNSTVNKTISLFETLKVPNLNDLRATTKEITLDNEEELLSVKEPSKGKFKGFFWGALASVATFAGLEAYGAKMANLGLSLPTFMKKENLDAIASKYLDLLSIKAPAIAGYALEAVASLLVGFIVYKLIVITKKLKNKKYVEEKKQESQEYKKRLSQAKTELINLVDHINNVKSVTAKYDIILQEQNAKINRMLFIEEPEDIHALHSKSKSEVEKTILILDEFVKLMDTPISKNDSVNPESIKNLKSANVVINEVIKGLY